MGAFEEINIAVAQVATNYGREYVKNIKNALVQSDKLASGALYKSINYNVTIEDTGVHLQLIYNDYLQWINIGRKPGTLPPVDKILEWVQERGIDTRNGATVRRMSALGRFAKASFKFNGRGSNGRYRSVLQDQTSMAWRIAMGIKQKGIKPTPILDKAAEKLYSPMQISATEAAVAVAHRYLDDFLANALQAAGVQVITTY